MTYAEEKNITIKHALMFRLVMDDVDNCKEFLQRALNIRIKKLKILEEEKSIEIKIGSKGIRLDVYVEDENGIAYDIEMQVGVEMNEILGKRSRYYQSVMDADALKKGFGYVQLRKSFIIFVCTYDPFGKELYYYSFSNLCHQDKGLELQDGCVKIILNTKGQYGNISRELKNLLDYIDKNIPNDEFTGNLDELVRKYKSDPKRSDLFMTYENLVATFEHVGEQREKLETAKRMLEDNELSIEKIAQYTGLELSKVKELAATLA